MTPSPALAKSPLAETVLFTRLPEELIRQRVDQIQQDVLEHSRHLREADFTAIHPHDLQFLFGAYDERFFGGLCLRALEARRLNFRLSPRMTRAGGKTSRCTAAPER